MLLVAYIPHSLQRGGMMYEYSNAHPKAASSHQILCTRYVGHPDLASSSDRLSRGGTQAPLHSGLGSRWLSQNDLTLDLSPFAAGSAQPRNDDIVEKLSGNSID